MTSMFWGLRLEPGKRYSTTVGRSFHVSMAALDCASVKNENEVNSVMLEETESSVPFILCNLQKQKSLQCPLDLNFMTGDRITFFCKGNGTIHLSGYVHEDPDDDEYANLLGEEEEDEEEDEEEEDDDEEGDAVSKGKKQLKANGLSGKRKPEDLLKNLKKAKLDTLASPEDDSDDEEDDDDFLEGLMEAKDESDDEDEDEDNEDEEEDDSEDEKTEVLSPKQQKKKQQQQQKNKNVQSNQTDKQAQNGSQLSKKEKKKGEAAKQKPEVSSAQKQQKPEVAQKKTVQGGVQIKDSRVGTGPLCKPGQKATVYYVGRMKDNNKVFDSARKGNGFTFTVGKGDVIKAWDVGVAGMKVGGKRTIICPPNMAYGQRGSPPTIPPNSTLVFEIELRKVSS